jgi:ribosome biogenesis GTPase
MMSDLKSLGYSDWFKRRVDDEKIAAYGAARIVSVHKESYTVTKGGEDVFARLWPFFRLHMVFKINRLRVISK